MTRSNLAVCFSPVIFSLNYDNKKKIKPHKISPSLLTVPTNPLLLQVTPGSSGKALSTARPNSTHVIFEPVDPAHDNSGVYYGPQASSPTSTSSLESSAVSGALNSSHAEELADKLSPNTASVALPIPSMNQTPSLAVLQQQQIQQQQQQQNMLLQVTDKSNSKRKYSEKLNKAATSIVNFGAETTSAFFSDSFEKNLSNLEYMSKVVQMCVADMIKYSMDLFTVWI